MIASGTFTVLEVDKPTKNGRIYPRAVVEKALEEYKQRVNAKKALCFVDSIEEQPIDLSQHIPTHIVNDIKLVEDKVVCHISTLPLIGEKLAQMMEAKTIEFLPMGWGFVSNDGSVSDYQISYIGAYPKYST